MKSVQRSRQDGGNAVCWQEKRPASLPASVLKVEVLEADVLESVAGRAQPKCPTADLND
jgi:hypothetical protein